MEMVNLMGVARPAGFDSSFGNGDTAGFPLWSDLTSDYFLASSDETARVEGFGRRIPDSDPPSLGELGSEQLPSNEGTVAGLSLHTGSKSDSS